MPDERTPDSTRAPGGSVPDPPKLGAIAPGVPAKKIPIDAPLPPGAISAEPMSLPPISLNPQPASRQNLKPPVALPRESTETKDTVRELIETVVFVVVLVLMLKTFLAEAFVIPTGSMADTLLGYHHKVTCKQCGYPNLVNASLEADPQGRPAEFVVSCQCQNCGFINKIR